MKRNYKFEAVGGEDLEALDITLKCTYHQAKRTFDAFAFAMATDGGWASLRMYVVDKEGRRVGDVHTLTFGGSNG